MKTRKGFVYRWDGLSVATWFAIGFLITGIVAGGEQWVPTQKHMVAAYRGEDCSIYRRLARRASQEIEENRKRIDFQNETLRKKRNDLEECARNQGISELRDDQDEALAAEMCPTVYEAWLSPGYRVQMVKQDLKSAREALNIMTSQIQWNCRPLPAAKSIPISTNVSPQ